jgi:hypothetical protein
LVARVIAETGLAGRQQYHTRLPQQVLVGTGERLLAREARRVVDEHRLEAAGGRVGHQSLELRSLVRVAPCRVQVDVLTDQRKTSLLGQPLDPLPLSAE